MEHHASSLLPRGTRRLFALAALLATLLASPSGHAAIRLDHAEGPTDYPDPAHVPNGCYLSAITFIKKFSAAYPTEQTRVIGFTPSGWSGGHFIAVVTWQGRWWVRDEYFGVFPTALAVGIEADPARFEKSVATVFDRHTTEYLRHHRLPSIPWDPRKLTSTQRNSGVATAAQLLPFRSETCWVQSGKRELPFLFFSQAPGQVAVYDPSSGTAVAHCGAADPALVVAAVAAKLGYQVDSVRSAAVLAAN